MPLTPQIIQLLRDQLAAMPSAAQSEQQALLESIQRGTTPTGGTGEAANPYTFPMIDVTAGRPEGAGIVGGVRPGPEPSALGDSQFAAQTGQAAPAAGGSTIQSLLPILGGGLVLAALANLSGKGQKKAPRTSFAGSLAGGEGYALPAREKPSFFEALIPAAATGAMTYVQGKEQQKAAEKELKEKSAQEGREALVELAGRGIITPEELGFRWETGSLAGLQGPDIDSPQFRPQDIARMFRYLPPEAKTRALQKFGLMGQGEFVKDDPTAKADFAKSILEDKGRPSWIGGDIIDEAMKVAAGGGDWDRLVGLYDEAALKESGYRYRRGEKGAAGPNISPTMIRMLNERSGMVIDTPEALAVVPRHIQEATIQTTARARDFREMSTIASVANVLQYSDVPEQRKAAEGIVSSLGPRVTALMQGETAPSSTRTELPGPGTGPDAAINQQYLDQAKALMENWPKDPTGKPLSAAEARKQIAALGYDPKDPYYTYIDRVISQHETGAGSRTE